ncbi:MAG: hypothetical protein ABL888_09355 [Pirellulaceae bacterium]
MLQIRAESQIILIRNHLPDIPDFGGSGALTNPRRLPSRDELRGTQADSAENDNCGNRELVP